MHSFCTHTLYSHHDFLVRTQLAVQSLASALHSYSYHILHSIQLAVQSLACTRADKAREAGEEAAAVMQVLCSYCAPTVLILCSYSTHTVLILCSYCTPTVLILHYYRAHTVLTILYLYCTYTVMQEVGLLEQRVRDIQRLVSRGDFERAVELPALEKRLTARRMEAAEKQHAWQVGRATSSPCMHYTLCTHYTPCTLYTTVTPYAMQHYTHHFTRLGLLGLLVSTKAVLKSLQVR
jgi:hypothetical protein